MSAAPAPGAPDAIVMAGCTAVRAEPSHRAEMVSQWLCGETLELLSEDAEPGWVRSRGPDGYVGWCLVGALLQVGARRAAAWAEEADRVSLGVRLLGPEDEDPHAPAGAVAGKAGPPGVRPAPPPRYLPWGARVAAAHEGRVQLPDGSALLPEDPSRLPDPVARSALHPARGPAVVGTAAEWLGTPYLWGGRTREGADCSGLVQAVYVVHGVGLPRDSRDQLAAGPPVPASEWEPSGRRPGDLLFFGNSAEEVTHVAVCAGGTRIIHAAAARGAASVDDLADLPEELGGLGGRLVGVTRPLAG